MYPLLMSIYVFTYIRIAVAATVYVEVMCLFMTLKAFR